jgi:hypothetical protein
MTIEAHEAESADCLRGFHDRCPGRDVWCACECHEPDSAESDEETDR